MALKCMGTIVHIFPGCDMDVNNKGFYYGPRNKQGDTENSAHSLSFHNYTSVKYFNAVTQKVDSKSNTVQVPPIE